MDIRESENLLFKKWASKYPYSTFVIDGCPNPKVYSAEKNKIIFVLKDGNLGKEYKESTYDQRNELETDPHHWWSTIAKWCYFTKNKATWIEAREIIHNKETIKQALSYHCFIQLKKEGGLGSVSNKTLQEVIKNDQKEILEQLSIYRPKYIVACGNGEVIADIFNCSIHNRNETIHGIGYWEVSLNNKSCFLIDYCHPSIRAGTKIKGLIAQGLAMAITEIEEKNSNK